MLSGHSFNALLKTLEEPPPHVKFLLATTDPQKIPVTVLSRCLQFNLKRLLPEQIDAQMSFILGQEKIEHDAAALKLLSRAADGSLRDGLSLLDQAIAFGDGEVRLDTVSNMLGTVAQQPVDDILLALLAGDAEAVLQKISEISELTPDFSGILQQILRVLHRVALAQTIANFVDSQFESNVIQQLAENMLPEDVQLFYQMALIGQRDLELAPDPRGGFEMVMLRMLIFKPDSSSDLVPAKVAVNTGSKSKSKRPSPMPAVVSENAVKSTSVDATNKWADMVAALNIRGSARELANNCVLDVLEENHCYLVLNPGHMISPRAEAKLQGALQEYCGRTLKLTIKAEKNNATTPAQEITQKREDKQQAAVDSINADESVLALKENFDARVMPGSVEPLSDNK